MEKQEEGPENKKLGPVTLRFMQTMESTLRVGVLMSRKAEAWKCGRLGPNGSEETPPCRDQGRCHLYTKASQQGG